MKSTLGFVCETKQRVVVSKLVKYVIIARRGRLEEKRKRSASNATERARREKTPFE